MRAITDHNTLILLYCVELEVLENLEAAGREKLMAETASVFRDRARCLRRAGRDAAARADLARADKLEADAKKLGATLGPIAQSLSHLRELTGQVQRFQEELDRVSRGPAPTRRQANSSPAGRSGQIELVNAWVGPVVVVIDGVTHRLTAGSSLQLVRPAGEFTYEVRDIQKPVTRKLTIGGTYTIRIGPQ